MRPRTNARSVVRPERVQERDNTTEEAWRVLDAASRWITHADAKAGAILAACGIIGGVLYNAVKSGGSGHRDLVNAGAALCAVLLAASIAGAGFALWPRRASDTPANSLIYFDDVARQTRYSEAEYVEALTQLLRDPATLTEQIGLQMWAVSRVASAKYVWVDRSMLAFLAALAALSLTLLAGALS
jgi:Family of unknown function (DUF5706)